MPFCRRNGTHTLRRTQPTSLTHTTARNIQASCWFWKRLANPPPKDPIAFPPDTALGKRSSASDPLFTSASSNLDKRPTKVAEYAQTARRQGAHYTSDSSLAHPIRKWIFRDLGRTLVFRASLSSATLAGSHNDSKSSKGKGREWMQNILMGRA